MTKLDGNDIVQEISSITLLFTDKELKKHFSEDAPKILKKCAKRIEEAYQHEKQRENEKANRHDQTT